jgi:thioredoxin reductase (NADPH)
MTSGKPGFAPEGAPPDRREIGDSAQLVLESSRPGIFSVGDVRSRSVKRVGEGSMAVPLLFDHLELAVRASAGAPHGH